VALKTTATKFVKEKNCKALGDYETCCPALIGNPNQKNTTLNGAFMGVPNRH